MKEIRWDLLKSERLKKTRGASFEDILKARLIAVRRHPTRVHQDILLFDYKGYLWVVPYVESGDHLFLKTLFPSRKYTKLYRRGKVP